VRGFAGQVALQWKIEIKSAHCNTLEYTATQPSWPTGGRLKSSLQTATHCNTLQHTATQPSCHTGGRLKSSLRQSGAQKIVLLCSARRMATICRYTHIVAVCCSNVQCGDCFVVFRAHDGCYLQVHTYCCSVLQCMAVMRSVEIVMLCSAPLMAAICRYTRTHMLSISFTHSLLSRCVPHAGWLPFTGIYTYRALLRKYRALSRKYRCRRIIFLSCACWMAAICTYTHTLSHTWTHTHALVSLCSAAEWLLFVRIHM